MLTEPLSVQRLLALGAAVDAALEGQGDDMLARASTALGPLAGLDAALLHEAVAASVARLGDV